MERDEPDEFLLLSFQINPHKNKELVYFSRNVQIALTNKSISDISRQSFKLGEEPEHKSSFYCRDRHNILEIIIYSRFPINLA